MTGGAMDDAPLVIGIDVGGTTIHAVAVDPETLDIVAETKTPTAPGIEGLRSGITATVAELALAGPIAGIGVGCPGLIGDHGVITHAGNLGIGAEPLDLPEALGPLTSGPVVVENDVKAAALGAGRWLAASEPDVRDFALLNVGTGLAGGIVLDGVLRRGWSRQGVELGHIMFDRRGPACSCGAHGCLELYASGSGLRRRWSATAADLFEAAADGDREAQTIAADLVDGLAHAVTLLAYTVDVERVLVTGGVVASTPALRAAVDLRLQHDGATPLGRATQVAQRIRWLPPDTTAGALGAAMLVTESTVITEGPSR